MCCLPSFGITVERLTFDIDPSKIKVRVIGTEICVSYEIFEFCFESKLQGNSHHTITIDNN